MLNKREDGNKVSGGNNLSWRCPFKEMTGTKGYTVDSLFKGHPRD